MENKIMTEVNEKKVSGSSFDNRGMGTVEMILIDFPGKRRKKSGRRGASQFTEKATAHRSVSS